MKIKEFFKDKKNIIMVVCVLVVAALLFVHSTITNSVMQAKSSASAEPTSNINPHYKEIMENGAAALTQDTTSMAENTTSTATSETKAATTAAPTTVPKTTTRATRPTTQPSTGASIPFATAIKPETPADYNAQWELGYLVAIDNPDTSYQCAKVELTEEDRDLLERLCMGEFGSGGFIGASLIAQAVKDAMCFDGYTSVQQVITQCRYTGSTSMGTTDECRQAVRYIFDENHDAVQHRIMYMYAPNMVQSAFHESQNFILSYQQVRFFDRWG